MSIETVGPQCSSHTGMYSWKENTVPGNLYWHASRSPKSSAFGFLASQGGVINVRREQLWDLTQRFSSKLLEWGFKKGDVICNTLANSRTRLVLDMGIMSAGSVVLNGTVFLKDATDIMMSFRQSVCKMVIIPSSGPAHDIFNQYLPKKFKAFNLPIAVTCDRAPSLEYVLVVNTDNHQDIDAFLADLALEPGCTEMYVAEDDPAFLFTTSGTTSLSKLVLRTHREVLELGETVFNTIKGADKFFNDRPLGWMGGFAFDYLVYGATRILQERTGTSPRGMTPGTELWHAMADQGVTAAMFSPSEIDQFLQARVMHKENFKPRLLRMMITGGQPIQKTTQNCLGVLTRKLNVLYASTECGLISCNTIIKETKDNFADFWVGELSSGNEMKIQPESNKRSTCGKGIGRLLLKGPSICKAYYDVTTPRQTSILDEDGWFDTEDIVYMDKRGDLYVTGRSCDTIQYGAALVHPALLEEQLRKCPGVKDVAVVGLRHSVHFQEICACIIPDKDCVLNREVLAKFCHQRYFIEEEDRTTPLPHHYFFMSNFPLTDTGKLSRKQLVCLIEAHIEKK